MAFEVMDLERREVLIRAHLQSYWRLMIAERKRVGKQSNDFVDLQLLENWKEGTIQEDVLHLITANVLYYIPSSVQYKL